MATVNHALRKAQVFDDIPMRRIFLRSPKDRVLMELERDSRAVPREAFRVVNAEIAGNFVDDAYLYSGSIHIVRTASSKGVAPGKYSIIYTPYTGTGGAAPSVQFDETDAVREFLTRRIRIQPSIVEKSLSDLSSDGSTSIPNVQLGLGELRRLGLA